MTSSSFGTQQPTSPFSPRSARRHTLARKAVLPFLASGLAVGLVVTAGQPASAGAATSKQPAPSPIARSVTASGEFLVAADPAAQAIYVYRASDLVRTGQLTGLGLSSHGGTVQLPDGRLIFVDDTNGTVAAIRVDADGRPRIVNNVSIPGGGWPGAAWAVTDPQQRYFAVSGEDDGDTRSVTIVDLASFAAHQVTLPATADSTGRVPEMQVYLAGSPLQLVVTTGGTFTSYPLAPILQGRTPEPTSIVPVGASTHGPVVSRDGRQVFSTTADGFDGATITNRKLSRPRSVAYSSTRNVVQLYRPRLAADDRHVWGSVAEDTGLASVQWADTRNDVNLIDTARFTSKLIRLPDGIAGRLAISSRYAAVTTMGPDGDVLTLLDADDRSRTFNRIVGTVALKSITNGPVAGKPTTGTESHYLALTPSGDTAFVSNGGDGKITAVDTDRRRETRTVRAPTSMKNGGYLTVIDYAGKPVTDLVAR